MTEVVISVVPTGECLREELEIGYSCFLLSLFHLPYIIIMLSHHHHHQ
jgi:hypothetical protein